MTLKPLLAPVAGRGFLHLAFSATWAGCVFVPTDPSQDTAAPVDTTIETLWSECSATQDTREVRVQTTGWTGGGLLALHLADAAPEEHPLGSIESAADGSWDSLRVSLSIVADPRNVARGQSTAMLCDNTHAEGLSFRLSVYEPDGEEEADCRTWGPAVDWESLGGYPPCDGVVSDDMWGD